MWNVCSTGGPQLGTPDFNNGLEQDGEEAKEVVGWGDKVENGEGILGIWDTANSGLFIPVFGTNLVAHWQRLADGGMECQEGAGKTGAAGKAIGKGGSR